MVSALSMVAQSALALLITVLAIFLALKLMGKIAKFIITLVVVALVLWLIFSNGSFLHSIIPGLGDMVEGLTSCRG